MILRAKRNANPLPDKEAALLLRINQGIPDPLKDAYYPLLGKRKHELLTDADQASLIRLSDEVERLEPERLSALSELATLRKTTLASLMKSLGIQAPNHG